MSTSTAAIDGSLWITRMRTAHDEEEVGELDYCGGGARRVFDHAHRVITTPFDPRTDEFTPGDLLVTLKDANGDLTDDDPLRVPARQADWFLRTWLGAPELATPEPR